MRARAMLAAGWLGLLGLTPGCGERAGVPDAVYLIVVDTLRSDRLSCYGCRAHETPNIDRIATGGVRFERAHSAASWTVPSMGALMTSRYPTQLGLVETPLPDGQRITRRHKRRQLDQTIPPSAHTLAEIFHENGYRTAAFVNQPALFIGDGFRQGFDRWIYPASATEVREYAPGEFPSGSIPYLREAHRLDAALVDAFAAWSREPEAGKRFAWIHLLTPHSPYAPLTGPGSREPLALYDAEIREVDELVGRLLATIDETVGLERALVVFTSDHGEAFGEHGENEHGNSLHREVVHVPLLCSAPGLKPGTTVAGDVRAIDVLPTILDLAGLAAAEAGRFEGVSLLPAIEGEPAPLDVFSEGMLYGSTERALVSKGFKLMFDEEGDRVSLYDLSWDANETLDVAESQPERVRALREELDSVHARLLREYEMPELSADEDRAIEAMRALGYTGVNEEP